jgi:hypothetical protein
LGEGLGRFKLKVFGEGDDHGGFFAEGKQKVGAGRVERFFGSVL